MPVAGPAALETEATTVRRRRTFSVKHTPSNVVVPCKADGARTMAVKLEVAGASWMCCYGAAARQAD